MAGDPLGRHAGVGAPLLVVLMVDGVELLALVQRVGCFSDVLGRTQAPQRCVFSGHLLVQGFLKMLVQRVLVDAPRLPDVKRWPVFRPVDFCTRLVYGFHAIHAGHHARLVELAAAFEHVPGDFYAGNPAGANSIHQYTGWASDVLFLGQFLLHLLYGWFHGVSRWFPAFYTA